MRRRQRKGEGTNYTRKRYPAIPLLLHLFLSYLISLSLNDSYSTMSCVVSEKLTPTPLEAVQVMVAKALSLVTLVALRVLVTLSVVMF